MGRGSLGLYSPVQGPGDPLAESFGGSASAALKTRVDSEAHCWLGSGFGFGDPCGPLVAEVARMDFDAAWSCRAVVMVSRICGLKAAREKVRCDPKRDLSNSCTHRRGGIAQWRGWRRRE